MYDLDKFQQDVVKSNYDKEKIIECFGRIMDSELKNSGLLDIVGTVFEIFRSDNLSGQFDNKAQAKLVLGVKRSDLEKFRKGVDVKDDIFNSFVQNFKSIQVWFESKLQGIKKIKEDIDEKCKKINLEKLSKDSLNKIISMANDLQRCFELCWGKNNIKTYTWKGTNVKSPETLKQSAEELKKTKEIKKDDENLKTVESFVNSKVAFHMDEGTFIVLDEFLKALSC